MGVYIDRVRKLSDKQERAICASIIEDSIHILPVANQTLYQLRYAVVPMKVRWKSTCFFLTCLSIAPFHT